MSRKYASAIFAVLIFAAVAVSASDFWVSKDWRQWSKDDCEKLLADSPWAHIWRRGDGAGPNPLGQAIGAAAGDQFVFTVQLRSALPIRQAIVRQLQFQQKYDKMNDAQRSDFDKQADQILTRSYDNSILVHVDFYKGILGPALLGDLRRFPKELEAMDVTLVTSDKTRIKAGRVELSKTQGSFDAVFPRTSDAGPILKEGQGHFWIQFLRPAVLSTDGSGKTFPGGPVEVEFDPAKMVVSGKFLY
jgi:hypothetical protein